MERKNTNVSDCKITRLDIPDSIKKIGWNNMNKYENKIRILSISAIILYIMFLIWALYFKFGNISFVRFCASELAKLSTKDRFLFDIIPFDFSNTDDKVTHFIYNFLNMFVFMPLSIFLIFKDGGFKFKHIIFCFIVSLVFEVVQFFTLIGGFAADDLLMNTSGYFAGFILYCLTFSKLSDKINFYLIIIANIVLLGIVIYAFNNIIPIFDQYVKVIKDFALKI